MIENALIRQVLSLPELIEQQYNDLEPKARKALTTPEIFGIQRIVLTGCGDSYAAALATKHAFEMFTNLPCEVVPAIELSRLYSRKQLGFAPCNPLVIAVSNSGSVVRVAEAIQAARKHGAFALGITGKRESLLGQSVDKIMDLNIPPFEAAPGTRSYMISVMSLLLVAIRIGEVRGCYTMDEAMDMRFDMVAQGKALGELLPDMCKQVYDIAEKWKNMEAYDFVGTGFDYAAAWFGHAKVFEALGKYAMHINSEEWLHMNFFMRNVDKIGTIIVANTTNPAMSRNKELIKFAHNLTRPLMVITDGGKEDFGVDTNYVKVPKTKYAINMPLTQFAPICLLCGYIMDMIGEEDGRGCKGVWKIADGARCIRESEMIVQ